MKTRPYIAYFRVSTALQGKSGLGREAQQQAVYVFLHGHRELIVERFIEIESDAGTTARNSPLCWEHAARTR